LNRRNVVVLVVISVLAVGIIAMKAAQTKKASSAVPSTEHIEGLLKGGRPGALVFTYKAECCEATRNLFDQFDQKTREILTEYSKQMQVAWVDISIEDEAYQQYLDALARKYGLTQVPAILVLNARAEKVDIMIGIPDAGKLRALIDRAMVR
jgi:hypothetical protein